MVVVVVVVTVIGTTAKGGGGILVFEKVNMQQRFSGMLVITRARKFMKCHIYCFRSSERMQTIICA